MTHYAWDFGACSEAITSVLGIVLPQSTTKTQCGKRVAMSRIDNNRPSCQACLEAKRKQDEAHAYLIALDQLRQSDLERWHRVISGAEAL